MEAEDQAMTNPVAHELYSKGLIRDCIDCFLQTEDQLDSEDLTLLGSLMLLGCSRFSTWAEFNAWQQAASDTEKQLEGQPHFDKGLQFLMKAVDGGSWIAANNLAAYYVHRDESLRAKYFDLADTLKQIANE